MLKLICQQISKRFEALELILRSKNIGTRNKERLEREGKQDLGNLGANDQNIYSIRYSSLVLLGNKQQ